MSKRSRTLAWLAGVALLVGAVIMLRDPEPAPDGPAEPPPIQRFNADLVVLPGPGSPPEQPSTLTVDPDHTRLRVSWADGLVGGERPQGVVGYEITWDRVDGEGRAGSRLVVAPDVLLDGLVDGERYRIQVRSVDAFGQRSQPTETTGLPEPDTRPRPLGLTEIYDNFTQELTQRWHLSDHRGCATARPGERGLEITLSCGSDVAVLRARVPLRLGDGEELGRVAVRTDAAGPGGELTIDLVPGRPDRVGVGTRRAGSEGGLPGTGIRVSVGDAGVEIGVGPELPAGAPTVRHQPVPRRGPGVGHLFEVALTTGGVRVYQDGLAVATREVRPPWPEAAVLVGVRGPEDRPSVVHVSGVGMSGPRQQPPDVVEAPVALGTSRVLALDEPAPDRSLLREPLVRARSAKVVLTLATSPRLDLSRARIQLGAAHVPARSTVPRPPTVTGASLTLVADIPQSLLGAHGPATIHPFVLRIPGGDATTAVVETYLEIVPAPGWTAPRLSQPPPLSPTDALPTVELSLGDAAGRPLPSRTLPPSGQVVLTVTSQAATSQWDTGAVAGVRGVEVYLDGRLIAAFPTDADGLGVGGTYALPIAVNGLAAGDHVLEARQYGRTGNPATAKLRFDVR